MTRQWWQNWYVTYLLHNVNYLYKKKIPFGTHIYKLGNNALVFWFWLMKCNFPPFKEITTDRQTESSTHRTDREVTLPAIKKFEMIRKMV